MLIVKVGAVASETDTQSVWELAPGVTVTLERRHDKGRLRHNGRVVRKAAGTYANQSRFFQFPDEAGPLLARLGVSFSGA